MTAQPQLSDPQTDAIAYSVGALCADEFRARMRSYHRPAGIDSPDPVVVFDITQDAATAVMASYVRLYDTATTPEAKERWRQMALVVARERRSIDHSDVEAQRRAIAAFLAEGASVRDISAT